MDDQSFLRDIIDNPKEEGPRLVYADWLDEKGDPRGEFIRLQLERPKLPCGSSQAIDARRREQALLKKHAKAWAGPIAKHTAQFEFCGGFVERISTSLKRFLESSDELFAAAPIRAVELRQCNSERIREFCDNKHLDRLSILDLVKCTIGPDDLQALGARSKLANLESLSIDETEFDIPMSVALSKCSFVQKLRALNIGSLNAITPSSVDLGALLKACPKLQYLSMLYCDFSPNDIRQIAAANLSDLIALDVPGRESGAASIDAVLASRSLKSLRWLDYTFAINPVRVANTKRNWERLGLSRSELTNDDAACIFNAKHLSEVKFLDLSYSRQLTTGCLKPLFESAMFANLECLRISFPRKLSPKALERIVAAWKDHDRPAGALCLPLIDLPPPAINKLYKRYGKGFFVSVVEQDWLLRPGETMLEVLDGWNRRDG